MRRTLSIAALLTVTGGSASADILTFTAVLNGAQENPPVATPATGSATLTFDTVTTNWSLDLDFGTLGSPMTIAHIHRSPVGVNGPVIIGLDGLPLSGGRPSWSLIAPGVTTFDSGGSLAAPFAFPAAEIPNLLAGNLYINIHSQTFGGGEIRGQLVPTPGAAAVLCLGGLLTARRRR